MSRRSRAVRARPRLAMPHLQPVIVHLSGPLRGTSRRPRGPSLRLGTREDLELPLPPEDGAPVGAVHARLVEQPEGWVLQAEAAREVWVNGELVERRLLASGDLLEIGAGGPLIRFRLQPRNRPFKTVRQALSDGYEGARRAPTPLGRAALLARGLAREIAREISPWARTAMAHLLLGLVAAVTFLTVRNVQLTRRLAEEAREVDGLKALLEASQGQSIAPADLDALRDHLEQRIASTADRVDFLEERADAAERTIREASRSVIFLQGAYGFREIGTGAPLRWMLSPEGRPLFDADGEPIVTTTGPGPVIEAFFTGTAFVVTGDGLALTNRHVARPWEFDEAAQQVQRQGLEPALLRMIGYLPGITEPFAVHTVAASDEADLAVLRCSVVAGDARALTLHEAPPRPGEAVIVLGFPTGIQAMMARADRAFLDSVGGQRLDFWQIAERLSRAGQIGPLATRGIVGQVTDSSIVYDADTTSGGSGGPVLTLDGRVIAINSAVLLQFGGSNIGVPAAEAVRLLDRAGRQPPSDAADDAGSRGPAL